MKDNMLVKIIMGSRLSLEHTVDKSCERKKITSCERLHHEYATLIQGHSSLDMCVAVTREAI